PAGVFTLNAKHHPAAKVWVGGDTMLINGQRVAYVRNSRHEASRAGRLLSAACDMVVAATGLVVPVNAAEITVKKAPEDVVIVPRMQLHKWLARRPTIWNA
ncbi:MAG: NERD domain-containing protein, partial [Actinobacteria bacterium]|nr:NERD domain-containing protein [Actinomycetota bacterium]